MATPDQIRRFHRKPKPAPKPEPKTFNRTDFTLEQINTFPLLARITNKWRQRNIGIYQHPTEPDNVITVGVRFDGLETVIVVEPKSAYERTLVHKQYVFE